MKKSSSAALSVTAIFAISALLSACADSDYKTPEWVDRYKPPEWVDRYKPPEWLKGKPDTSLTGPNWMGPHWSAKELNRMIKLKNRQGN